MKKLKKCAVRLMSLAVMAVTVLAISAVGLNASAAAVNYKWTVDRSSSDLYERTGWTGNGKTIFSVDDKVHTDNSWFSIKIENTDYNTAYVERTYNVEPNAKYKFSAMVKYSGYQLEPDADPQKSGANIGKAYYYNGTSYISPNSSHQSDYTKSSNWTLLEYEFTTGNENTYNLCLKNHKCKGTAWFSDVKLEKAELTNNWDILTVFFKNIDATVSLDDKIVHHKSSITDSQINEINTYVLDQLPSELKSISNNKITVNSIDRFYIDETLTEKDLKIAKYSDDAKTIPHGYNIDTKNSESIPKVLDNYLNQKNYNQILVFSPLYGIDGGTLGWGGTKYNGVNIASIVNRKDGGFKNSSNGYPCATVVHEICHGLESESKEINNNKTADFHDMYDYPDLNGIKWHTLYINDMLPDGKKGVEPAAFYRSNGEYTLVDDDMSTGTGITPGSSSITPPVPKNFRAESVSDTHIKFSWDIVPNADGYQFVRFKSADHKEMSKDPYDYKADRSSGTWGPYTIGNTYYYGIRTTATIDGKTVYSDWTYLTYTHAGVGVIYGDINSDGDFNILDVADALTLLLANTDLSDNTLKTLGINIKSEFTIYTISKLLSDCLS